MGYKENPKTKGSGIVCAIPQKGICPNRCEDCFFQSGRSYENTPYEKWVYSCGKIEGEAGTNACRHCGNCLREYYATLERMRPNS